MKAILSRADVDELLYVLDDADRFFNEEWILSIWQRLNFARIDEDIEADVNAVVVDRWQRPPVGRRDRSLTIEEARRLRLLILAHPSTSGSERARERAVVSMLERIETPR